MNVDLLDGPLLWFVDRSSGLVTMLLLTVSTVIGVLSTRGRAGRGLPVFVVQNVHRNISLLAMALLAVHVVSSVAHEFVDIRWWHAVVPFGSPYEPLLVGLGTLATDLLLLVVVTSLVRGRMPHLPWRVIHLSAYGAWGLGTLHGLLLGTDTAGGGFWALVSIACAVAVALAIGWRLVGVLRGPRLGASV